MKPKQIETYLKENWLEMTNEAIGEHIGKSATTVRRMAVKLGLPSKQGLVNTTRDVAFAEGEEKQSLR